MVTIIEIGYLPVVVYLINEKYISFLNTDEMMNVFDTFFINLVKSFFDDEKP